MCIRVPCLPPPSPPSIVVDGLGDVSRPPPGGRLFDLRLRPRIPSSRHLFSGAIGHAMAHDISHHLRTDLGDGFTIKPGGGEVSFSWVIAPHTAICTVSFGIGAIGHAFCGAAAEGGINLVIPVSLSPGSQKT